ncbi:hypothetical protein HDN1F_00330 [gamma proteobacterium HdN1]|nr:hypothetical protein HDN1F_00330 [gamma proteobacterium HdN1]
MTTQTPSQKTVAPRDAAIEHYLSQLCLKGIVATIVLIIIGMATEVQNHVDLEIVTVWGGSVGALVAFLVSATALRNKAASRENGALWGILAMLTAIYPLLLAPYFGLYVGAGVLLVHDLTGGNYLTGLVRVITCVCSYYVFRDALRLILATRHFALQSPRLEAVIAELAYESRHQ